jgi:hypothetical protein
MIIGVIHMRMLSVIILLLLIVAVHLLSCRPTVASVHVSSMTYLRQAAPHQHDWS